MQTFRHKRNVRPRVRTAQQLGDDAAAHVRAHNALHEEKAGQYAHFSARIDDGCQLAAVAHRDHTSQLRIDASPLMSSLYNRPVQADCAQPLGVPNGLKCARRHGYVSRAI